MCINSVFDECCVGQSDKIQATLKDKFWPTLLAGYAVWPLAHVINFRFIPNSQRVLYINAVNVSQPSGTKTEQRKLACHHQRSQFKSNSCHKNTVRKPCLFSKKAKRSVLYCKLSQMYIQYSNQCKSRLTKSQV